MWKLESNLVAKTTYTIRDRMHEYFELELHTDRLTAQTKLSVEILDDDHGKAILVFTIVTLVFLPLSFVTSFLGMNTADIRNQDSTQSLFWEIALPLTGIVSVLALLIAFRYDSMREWIDPSRKKFSTDR
jgi:Mg2+ and Co2+ transporter CorA